MPKPLPVYQDYNLLQAALLAKCPSLVLSTTQQDFIDLLRNRGKSCPSQITISMTNTQGITKFAHASDFLQGHNRNMTDAEFQASMQQCSAKQKGNHVREVASIEMLAASFALHEFNLVDLTQDVESGAADGYLDSETETSFVGIQATRAIGENRTGNCKIAKSKECMLNQVCELGFMFFGMLFVGDNWRGVLFLSPDDAALIRSLPNFKYLNLALGKNGIRIKKEKRNSLIVKLSKNIFLWENSDNLHVQK